MNIPQAPHVAEFLKRHPDATSLPAGAIFCAKQMAEYEAGLKRIPSMVTPPAPKVERQMAIELLSDLGAMPSIVVPVPPSTNNLFVNAGKRRVTSSKYQDWQNVAIPILRALSPPTQYPVGIVLTVEEKVRSSRDIDNFVKPILDAIVKAELIVNDNVKHVAEVTIRYRPSDLGAGVRVEFTTPK